MDMWQYQEVFLEESFENLQNLNQYLLELENAPDNLDTVNKIFRVAHTLKGMAASMGFNYIAELTHSMESVLDKLRNGSLRVNPHIITLLFNCLDTLEGMIKDVQNGVGHKIDISSHINMLDAEGANGIQSPSPIEGQPADNISLKHKPASELNIYDKNVIKEAVEKGYNVLCVDIKISKDCILKAARAFLVYNTLDDSGEIIKCEPSVEDIEQENFDSSFSVLLLTLCPPEKINSMLYGISEVEQINITNISESNNAANDSCAIAPPVFQISNPEKGKDAPVERTEESNTKKPSRQSVRVDLDRLDTFMSIVGELVIHKTRLEELCSNIATKELRETLEQVGRISSDLQDLVMQVRMVPVDKVFSRFPRMMRDLSRELNKQISFIIEGEDTELDRTVIDELGEPLIHLLRNAADHGIELPEERKGKGKDPIGIIKLSAFQQGNRAIIKLVDDGAGLNIIKIKNKATKMGINTSGMSEDDLQNLIFMQGFSTSDKVTEVSGRGVGMDAVKSKISSLGGTIDVISKTDKGSTIIISLPLTLSIIQVLLVKLGCESFGISLGYVERVMTIKENEIKQSNGRDIIIYQNKIIPLVKLAARLNIAPSNSIEKYAVITSAGEKNIALLVDSLVGQQEIVIKPLGKSLNKPKEYVGATILGDGLVTLILDATAFI